MWMENNWQRTSSMNSKGYKRGVVYLDGDRDELAKQLTYATNQLEDDGAQVLSVEFRQPYGAYIFFIIPDEPDPNAPINPEEIDWDSAESI